MNPEIIPRLKKELKALKIKKGLASKTVGEAKRNNLPIESLINNVQQISQQIKSIESQIKDNADVIDLVHAEKVEELAPQFIPQKLIDTSIKNLKIVTDISSVSWDEYINQHPNSTIYHSQAIRQVIENTFGHNCHYLAACDENGKIQGVLPLTEMKSKLFAHFMVSLPFFNYGGILANTTQAKHELKKHASAMAEKIGAGHVEYRHCYPEQEMPTRQDKVTMLLNLPDSNDQLWSNLGTKLRAQVKKSERNGLTSKIGKKELINDFYKVFSINMRDLGTPVYSKELFTNMITTNPSASICVVYRENKAVSAGFVIGWKNTLEIPWASTLKQANKYDANMKLYWEILKYAQNQGYKIFDFGRSSKDANTYRFKKQWGAKPYPLFWHYWLPENHSLPKINPHNPKFRIMIATWKQLPMWIANNLGPFIVKSIP